MGLGVETVAVTIGAKCRTVPEHVQREWLSQEVPIWFDGTNLYQPSGKYTAEFVEGDWKLRKWHDISTAGMLRWFAPCEYLSYNSLMMGLYETQQEAEQRAREELLAKLAKAEQRVAVMCDVIEGLLAEQPVAKRATVKCGDIVAEGYGGDWCVYRTHDRKRYMVAHIPLGMAARSFPLRRTALQFLQFLSIWTEAGKRVKANQGDLKVYGALAYKYVEGDRSEETVAQLLVLLVDLDALGGGR